MKAAIALVLATVLAGNAEAQTLPRALTLPKGAVLVLSVEETNTDVFAGQTQRVTGTVGYTETVESAGERLHVVRTLRDQSGEFAGDPSDWVARAAKVGFWTDARMTPQAIDDYPALVTAIFETGPLAGASEEDRATAGLSPSRRRIFERLSPEQAAQGLLQAQTLLAGPQAKGLTVGQKQVQQLPNGGTWTQAFTGLDAQGLGKVTFDVRQEGRMGPDALLVATVHCDYLVDMTTGLTRQATCLTDRDLKAPDNMSRKTTQRLVMSQGLATKP